MPALLTVGHGTAGQEEFASLLAGAGVAALVDVRTAPGSRRHPHFGHDPMQRWLPDAGIAYRWEKALGGFRRPRPESPNAALRHPSFRGYADYMRTDPFRRALDAVLAEAAGRTTIVMCSEGVWWRCHRRLIADAAVLLTGTPVLHLFHDGRLTPHEPMPAARVDEHGLIVYDVGVTLPLDTAPGGP